MAFQNMYSYTDAVRSIVEANRAKGMTYREAEALMPGQQNKLQYLNPKTAGIVEALLDTYKGIGLIIEHATSMAMMPVDSEIDYEENLRDYPGYSAMKLRH